MKSTAKKVSRVERGKLIVDNEALNGAEELRLCVSNMNCNSDLFNGRFTAAQLLQINRMLVVSEWDIFPDRWTRRQVREALAGKPPRFDDNERPSTL